VQVFQSNPEIYLLGPTEHEKIIERFIGSKFFKLADYILQICEHKKYINAWCSHI
jgi:hypothetical protein